MQNHNRRQFMKTVGGISLAGALPVAAVAKSLTAPIVHAAEGGYSLGIEGMPSITRAGYYVLNKRAKTGGTTLFNHIMSQRSNRFRVRMLNEGWSLAEFDNFMDNPDYRHNLMLIDQYQPFMPLDWLDKPFERPVIISQTFDRQNSRYEPSFNLHEVQSLDLHSDMILTVNYDRDYPERVGTQYDLRSILSRG